MKVSSFTWRLTRLAGLSLFVTTLSHCTFSTPPRTYLKPTMDLSATVDTGESYKELVRKWTVVLGLDRPGGPAFGVPFANPRGEGLEGGFGVFPLTITATLMDPKVIKAGVQHYADLLGMTVEEMDQFRKRYHEIHDVDDMILIWLDIRTTFSETYLNLDRWAIFVEDDRGKQYEPAKVLESPVSEIPQVFDFIPEGFDDDRMGWMTDFNWRTYEKVVSLYFPRRDFYGNPVIKADTQFLKLVFFQWWKEAQRSEGVWWFSEGED